MKQILGAGSSGANVFNLGTGHHHHHNHRHNHHHNHSHHHYNRHHNHPHCHDNDHNFHEHDDHHHNDQARAQLSCSSWKLSSQPVGDQCHTSDDRDEDDGAVDVDVDDGDVDGVDVDDGDVDNSDVDYNDYYDDGRLVGRRPGDVASCFASAGKVLLPSLAFPCNLFVPFVHV